MPKQVPFESRRRSTRSSRGLTLIEMLIAMGAAGVIMGALLATALFIVKTFVIIGNYNDLDQASRHALDVMSRDVRNASYVTNDGNVWSTNQFTLVGTNSGSTVTIQYVWDGQSNFTRFYNGAITSSNILLTDCDFLCVSNYQRNPTNNFTFYSANTVDQTKLLDVRWHCWRPVLGSKLTTESVQTAKIVVRN